MGDCKVCDNRTLANAWQYNGDIESAPVWVNQPPYTGLERDDDTLYLFIASVGNIPLNKGDWIVKSNTSNAIHVYSNNAFSLRFTIIPEKEKKPADSVASQKYRLKPITVDAWRYQIGFDYKTAPGWIFNLIVNHRLGYPNPLEVSAKTSGRTFQLYDGHFWIPVLPGEWVVRYDDKDVAVVTNEDFKSEFEEIK